MANEIDFSNCRVILGRAYNGANGKKIAIEYNGERYMLKFPPSGNNKPTGCHIPIVALARHIASSIFNILGIKAQETLLGTLQSEQRKK